MKTTFKNLALAAALLSAAGSWQSLRAQSTLSGGTLTLGGSNTYTGATTTALNLPGYLTYNNNTGGTLTLGSTISAINTGTLTFSGATVGSLTLNGTTLASLLGGSGTLTSTGLPGSFNGTITLANGGTVTLHAGASIKVNADGTYTVSADGAAAVSAANGGPTITLTGTGTGTVSVGAAPVTSTPAPTNASAAYTLVNGPTGTVVTTPTGTIITMPIFFDRDYSGTVTRTTAAGVTTTGSFDFGIDGRGRLSGTITLDGVSTTYVGALGHDAAGARGQTGSGYLVAADAAFKRTAGAEKIPLYVTYGTLQGGTLDAGGNTLVFRGGLASPQVSDLPVTVGN